MRYFFSIFMALVGAAALSAQTTITVEGVNYSIAGDSAEVVAATDFFGYEGDIVIPSSITYQEQVYRVTSIGRMACFMDNKLKSITIGEGVTMIGERAFSSCTGLKSVKLPQSLNVVGASAFYGCDSLPVVDGLRYADTYLVAATDNKITSATIKEGTRWIGSNALEGCKFSTIILPESVIGIGSCAFFSCFSLSTITIPANVKYIDEKAFSQCLALGDITCHAIVPPVCGSDVFKNVTKTIPVHVPGASLGAYKAANGWKDFTNIKGDITAIEEVESSHHKGAAKMFRDGKVVILSNGQTYSITGAEW